MAVTTAAALRELRAPAGSPVDHHGHLRVLHGELLNQERHPVMLRGIGLAESGEGGDFWNPQVVQWVKEDWNASVIRVTIGVEDEDGYLANPAAEKARVRVVVQAAVEAGIYVIINWHDSKDNLGEARHFFAEMAETYGGLPNVLFEIYHEPEESEECTDEHRWRTMLKPYNEQVVAAIREASPNLIILGSGAHCLNVDSAAADPLLGSNLAYAVHFFAATPSHRQPLRNKVEAALAKQVCLFASEWATTECSGDGPVDLKSAQYWMDFVEDKGISHVNWALCDANRTSSALQQNAPSEGGWGEHQLTESGCFVRKMLRSFGPHVHAGKVTLAEPAAPVVRKQCCLMAYLNRCLGAKQAERVWV